MTFESLAILLQRSVNNLVQLKSKNLHTPPYKNRRIPDEGSADMIIPHLSSCRASIVV